AIHTEALKRCERALGDRHRRTAEVLNSLALRLAADKRTRSQAPALYERALAIHEHVLRLAHPATAQTMNNLAAVLSDLDQFAAARALLERSLVQHEQIFGPDHPRLAYVLSNLAGTYKRERDYAAARPLYERALIIRERALGA